MLETERLLHRPFTVEDVERFVAIRSKTDVARYIGGAAANTKAKLEKRLAYYRSTHETKGFGIEAIVWKDTNTIIGWSGLQPVEDTPHIQLTYGLTPEFWRKGIGVETALAWLNYGFEQLQLKQIVALADPNNTGSCKIMEKVGMQLEGLQLYKGIDCCFYTISKAGFSISGLSGRK